MVPILEVADPKLQVEINLSRINDYFQFGTRFKLESGSQVLRELLYLTQMIYLG